MSPPSPGIEKSMLFFAAASWGNVFLRSVFFLGGEAFLGRMFFGIGIFVGGLFGFFSGVGESFSAVLEGFFLKTAPHFVWS